ncbi:MAG TPA: TatD family hydrolase, partial [Prolixibacteraceae bacterium]
MKIPFIDIHTHLPVNSEEITSVQSLFLQDVDFNSALNLPFTAAIHPWHAEKFATEHVSSMLQNLMKQPGLIAIGETGLDKICPADYLRQKLLFELQLEFAEDHHLPLIIHTVKSWNDLLVYLKHSSVPFVLHGYSSGMELTKQLIDLGCYFSVGKSVLKISPRFRESLQIIPRSSLFLETDDSFENITKIYQETAAILDIQLD